MLVSTKSFGRMIPAATLFVLLLLAAAAPAFAQQLVMDPHHAFPQELIFTVDLVIECGGEQVKGVEVALTFEETLLRLDDLTPGSWFTESGKQFYFFDYTDIEDQGNIHVASSILEGTHGADGVFATLHFSSRQFGTTPVDFVDLDVRGADNMGLGFTHSLEDSITIDPAVDVTPYRFGNLKAIYR